MLKFVLTDMEGMQQSMQRIFMEKKTTRNKDQIKKADKKQEKKDKLQSGKQCSGMLWKEKHVLNINDNILKF